jgi:hypothetical protein
MIAIAPYPNSFHYDYSAIAHRLAPTRQHDKVVEHYNNVSDWCKENLTGPYEIDEETDILSHGVRVRVGRESDLAYFHLRWG